MLLNFSFKKSTIFEWMVGILFHIFLILFIFFSISENWQKQLCISFLLLLLVYYIYLFRKFLDHPSEIIIDDQGLKLKFRNAPGKIINWDEIKAIQKSCNPFRDGFRGKLEIHAKNLNEKYTISGAINDYDSLIKVLNDRGFEIN